MAALVLALTTIQSAHSSYRLLDTRGAVSLRVPPRSVLRRIVSLDDSGAKGFGKDPSAESRVARKLESLRSPEQRQRMQEQVEAERMDQYIRDEGLDSVPEAVSDRMLKRMIFFLGVPIAGGVLAFAAFIIAARYFDTVIKPTTVASTTQFIFFLGVIGITYGPLSASWDEDREGSLLGYEEVGKNFQNLMLSMKDPPKV